MEKRFQECGPIVKLFRYRFYIPIPFKYIWYSYIKPFKIIETVINEKKGIIEDSGNIYIPKGKNLWSLLVGQAQHEMKWYWTSEEVFKKLKNKKR